MPRAKPFKKCNNPEVHPLHEWPEEQKALESGKEPKKKVIIYNCVGVSGTIER